MVVLGVEESLSGKKWLYRNLDERKIAYFVQKYNFPEILARILVARHIEEEALTSFLHPTLKHNLPDPYILKDAEKTALRIVESIERHEKIGIMGDYDVDGATSSALLKLFLESLGIRTRVFIPDRDDGYGPNIEQMEIFYKDGIRLVATVDCGMTAFEPIDYGTKLGLDIVIIDHHEPERMLPNAYAVVNPKRLDEDKDNPCHSMAAVGVVFLVVVAINRLLRERGFFKGREAPELKKWLDLVAFGTVCDVVPLKGVNRLFVQTGLKQVRRSQNIGLKALVEISKISEPVSAYHLGYILGPRINAGGRVGQSDLGMKLLSTFDEIEAQTIANELEDLNVLRREIETQVLEEADIQAQKAIEEGKPYLLVHGNAWHQGVVGIVAGRLKEKYNLPCFALSIEKGEAKGSSRSIPGIDLGTIVITALQKGILLRGGGHPMAAGFSLEEGKIKEFEDFLTDFIQKASENLHDTSAELEIDGVLDIKGVTVDLLKRLDVLEPYCESNPEPRFVIQNVLIKKTIITKNGHVICKLSGQTGGYLDAVCFRAEETEIGKALLSNNPAQSYNMAGYLRLDTWRGKNKVQLFIQDVAKA